MVSAKEKEGKGLRRLKVILWLVKNINPYMLRGGRGNVCNDEGICKTQIHTFVSAHCAWKDGWMYM